MARVSKRSYTGKQKRKAQKIETRYRKRGVTKGEAERRAWATVNKRSGGGEKKSGSSAKRKTTTGSRKGSASARRRGKRCIELN